MRWAKDLPYYDVYAPRDATRCLRAVEGAMHCGRRGGRRGSRRGGRRGGRRGAGVAAGVARQGAHHEGHLEGHEDPCGRHEGEQRGDETHTWRQERVRLERATGFHAMPACMCMWACAVHVGMCMWHVLAPKQVKMKARSSFIPSTASNMEPSCGEGRDVGTGGREAE